MTVQIDSPMDPAPRSYPAAVTLKRRSARGAASAPAQSTADEIEAWLLGDAARENDLLMLFESFCWRLASALPVARASLHIGTLHPQIVGLAWNWERADGLCDEVRIEPQAMLNDAYKRNPLALAMEHGQGIALDVTDGEAAARYPILNDLKRRGYTQYRTIPLAASGVRRDVATLATQQTGGLTAIEAATALAILRLFSLHVQRHSAQRIASNVVETYLGTAASKRVLEGTIQRGSGEAINAVIWSSDLRGFTDLSDRLAPDAMITLLNAYFECMAGAVLHQGGEVLKFIGDGLLAAFPLERTYRAGGKAADAALAAARQSLAALDRLNAAPPRTLADVGGWRPLRTGIGLHEGEVFFGNVGSPDRLDFTVIGAAVNAAARVEALTKDLKRPVLITAPVAAQLSRESLEPMGAHVLRGLHEAIDLFSPALPSYSAL